MEWHPYIMRRSIPCHRSGTINTDDFGFRCTASGGKLLSFDDLRSYEGPVGLISGNSTAFGVGTSSDFQTVSSVLNQSSGHVLWYNMAHRAANFTQERINLDLYAPPQTEYLVFLSGANNLIVTLLEEGGERFSTPFVGEPNFLKLNRAPVERPALTLEQRYGLMLETMSIDFKLLGQKLSANGWRCLFLLQPIAAWCDRNFSPEERELISIWDEHPSRLHAIHSEKSLARWRSHYTQSLQSCCEDNGIDFIDLNTNEQFLSGRWVFADRIHLADEGHHAIARIVKQWVHEPTRQDQERVNED